MTIDAVVALLAVAAAHAGFQLTVSALVYPALVATPAADWDRAHDRHSRRIAPLVVLIYGGLVVTGAWVVASEPLGPALVVALLGSAGTLLLTATLAAPLHGRLGAEGPRAELLRRLVRVDRARAVLAVVILITVSAAALTR